MDVGGLDRGDAGALGLFAAGGEGTHAPAVFSGAGGGLGGRIPGRTARRGAAQDRLDAGGSCGRSWALASAGRARSRTLGCRRPARRRAGLCPGDPGRPGRGSGSRRDRLPQAGQSLVRCASPVHRLGRQDHELSDRRVRGLRLAARSRVHRSGLVPAQDLDLGSGPIGRRPRAGGDELFDQAGIGSGDDRAGDGRRRAVLLGGGRHRLRGRRHRDGATPRGQGLRARGQDRSPVQFLGRQAAGGRHRRGDRERPRSDGLDAPVGGRGHEGRAAVRLGLLRVGRPRRCRLRPGPACGRAAC